MSSSVKSSSTPLKFTHLTPGILYRSLAIAGLVLFFFYALLIRTPFNQGVISFHLKRQSSPNITVDSAPTNISHIGFIVVSSVRMWKHRRPYTESWWRSNVTRGYVFLDKEPPKEFLPWPSKVPPYRVNEEITKLRVYPKLVNPVEVRIMRSILDMYRAGDKGLRWFIMCDDDTLFFVDNLVEVLGKYDHTKFFYIGGNSESIKSNADFSFEMGFGGAGYALSYPLVEALVKSIDGCIERYPHLFLSDHRAQHCLADIGVALTIERGIHQIDLHDDISGLLSAHPQSPLLTLHHFDTVNPIFPTMDKYQSTRHLMKAADLDQSRLLQQTICYHRESNWSFSVSWGYSVHVYESIISRTILRKPLETFTPWSRTRGAFFMFNTRRVTKNPCEVPHVYFFESIEHISGDKILTTYVRASPRNLPSCSTAGNHSADPISRIQVLSPASTRKTAGEIECCDVVQKGQSNTSSINLRSCMNGEVIA
ncbi:hypothetical protein K2173_016303 [Erythroxylum novogranatense]|uniref:Uncharacterized protein n=1 Tax=Erythroxylum novogranatense TaxID=1862640 RepID=A0AAV8SFW3_9ROSI|nr:hypothetical protein K2173_016303 [Erythroxylum novogranatense]